MILAKSYDDLVSVFHEAEKPQGPNLIGTEMEKPGVFADGRPITYSSEISKIFEALAAKSSWTTIREQDDRPVIALERTLSSGLTASITLEPGSQFELSGAPLANMHETDAELREHMQELETISKELGIHWLGIGFHPYSKREDFEWVPKLRYGIMQSYLPTRGQLAQDMMLRTS
ncbi:MAG: glutamate--cysteine ligase, partial [Polyangiaceae bacterium]|nr:glutamate--cysteine ligase [Polyangiaceae bacterium]